MTHALAATFKGSWIIDSGATCHICNDETLFRELRLLDTPIYVTLGDGRCLKGIAEGTVKIETLLPDGSINKCKLENVLLGTRSSSAKLGAKLSTSRRRQLLWLLRLATCITLNTAGRPRI